MSVCFYYENYCFTICAIYLISSIILMCLINKFLQILVRQCISCGRGAHQEMSKEIFVL